MDNCWRCRWKSRWCLTSTKTCIPTIIQCRPATGPFLSLPQRDSTSLHTRRSLRGSAWVAGSATSTEAPLQFQPKTGTTNGVFQIGGGLDVTLYRKFSLRGELRDFWSGVPKLNVSTNQTRQHNLFVGGGVVWHF